MGCSSSKADTPAPAPTPAPAATTTVTAQPAPAGGGGGGGGRKEKKFQIKLSGEWKDYDAQEDAVLKRAFLVGQPNCRFKLRGQSYEYNFKEMKQKNLGTNKERDIRPPPGMKAPRKARLPTGPMVIIKVPKGSAGKSIKVADPNNPGQEIRVNVPKGAKAGAKMAVPIPAPGESVEAVREKQKEYSKVAKLTMGTAGVAAVGGIAVAGVILGDHLSDGAVADFAGEHLGADVGDAMAAATDWTTDAAADAGEWIEGAVEDFPEYMEDAGEAIADAAEDAGDWLGDAAEDVGDFIMDLF